MKYDRGILEICAFGADGFPNLSRPKICDCSIFLRSRKRRRNHALAFLMEIEIIPPRYTLDPLPPMPPSPVGPVIKISREAVHFLLQFDLTDKTMGRILDCSRGAVASIRRDEMGIMDGGWTFPPDHPCEVCGEPSQVGPDKRNKMHGWICQPCFIAKRCCDAMHRWILAHKREAEIIRELHEDLQQYRSEKSRILPIYHRAVRWLKTFGHLPIEYDWKLPHRTRLRESIGDLYTVNESIRLHYSRLNRREGILRAYMEAQFGGGISEDIDFIDILLKMEET